MMLMVGGMSQGKLPYALEMTGLSENDVARDFAVAKGKPIFYGLHTAVRRAMEAGQDPVELMHEVMDANPNVLIICDEIGCGVVPIDPFEREWRDQVGRICCEIAKNSIRVERIVCGLSQRLKGDAWN